MKGNTDSVLNDLVKPDTLTVSGISGFLTVWTTPLPLTASLSTFWWLAIACGKFLFFATTGTIITTLLKAHIEPLVNRLPWLRRLNSGKKEDR